MLWQAVKYGLGAALIIAGFLVLLFVLFFGGLMYEEYVRTAVFPNFPGWWMLLGALVAFLPFILLVGLVVVKASDRSEYSASTYAISLVAIVVLSAIAVPGAAYTADYVQPSQASSNIEYHKIVHSDGDWVAISPARKDWDRNQPVLPMRIEATLHNPGEETRLAKGSYSFGMLTMSPTSENVAFSKDYEMISGPEEWIIVENATAATVLEITVTYQLDQRFTETTTQNFTVSEVSAFDYSGSSGGTRWIVTWDDGESDLGAHPYVFNESAVNDSEMSKRMSPSRWGYEYR